MNSKLRDTLSDIIRLKLSIPLTTETLLQGKVTDNLYKIEAEAEQAIRKAVGEEMLELLPSQSKYKTVDSYKKAVRQKIKQWAALKETTNSAIQEDEEKDAQS